MAYKDHGLCGYELNSYGLHSYGLRGHGQHSYGLHTCGLHSYGLRSHGQHRFGLHTCGLHSYGLDSYGPYLVTPGRRSTRPTWGHHLWRPSSVRCGQGEAARDGSREVAYMVMAYIGLA